MPSPQIEAAAASTRTEAEARAARQTQHRITVARRLGGTTDADIEDRERDNIANGQG